MGQEIILGKKKECVLVTGSREFSDENLIYYVLKCLFVPGTILLHGKARGADKLCGKIGKKIGYKVYFKEAEWKKYGNQAGHIRNRELLEIAMKMKVVAVVAFPKPGAKNIGTFNMIHLCAEKGRPVLIFPQGLKVKK